MEKVNSEIQDEMMQEAREEFWLGYEFGLQGRLPGQDCRSVSGSSKGFNVAKHLR